jgi:tol-pal system protein YbgF
MTKNFDLLEQSVSLTLSKTITADLSGKPAAGPAPMAAPAAAAQPTGKPAAQTAQAAPGARPAATPKAARPAVAQAALPQAALPQAAAPRPATLSGNPAHVSAVPVAMGTAVAAQEAALDDPDLLPPASPRHLSAHPEAKPLYEKGFTLFARKDYDQSIIVFQNFLKRFPDDIYSDNAQFWIAEAYLNENRPAEAESGYRAVLRNYEHRSTLDGYKTPDAIYRLGQLYARRGEQRRAHLFFGALAERFPETSAGRKAQRELDTLTANTASR